VTATHVPHGVPRLPGTGSLAELTRGAVDSFDVAARLEASGMSDRTVRGRHGRPDVFTLAEDLHDGSAEERVPSGRLPVSTEVGEAMRRAALLIAGVLLAAAVLDVTDLGAELVWMAGVAGWVGGQVVAAIAWTRLGQGQLGLGMRRGSAAALLVLGLAASVPLVVAPDVVAAVPGMVLCTVWAGYACAVSLLVCARRTGAALGVVLSGLLFVVVALVAGQPWSPIAVLVASTAAATAVALLAVRVVVSADGPELPDGADVRAAAPALGQAALLATSLLVLLQTVSERNATSLVVASVVGAAAADPAIALLRTWLTWSVARVHHVAVAARRARRAAVVAAAGTAFVSALAAVAVVLTLQVGVSDWSATVGPAAAYTALATTSAALTAFGAPWRAVVAAALAGGYATAALLSGIVAVAVVFPLALVGAVALLLHRVSDPRVVA
jgi:hypothetical protein